MRERLDAAEAVSNQLENERQVFEANRGQAGHGTLLFSVLDTEGKTGERRKGTLARLNSHCASTGVNQKRGDRG